MSSDHPSQYSEPDGKKYTPGWLIRFIANIQEKLAQNCAKKQKESAQDKINRRLADATVVIACLAFVSLIIGILQWDALRRADEKTRDQLTLAYPPRLRVMNLSISPIGERAKPVAIKRGTKFDGEAVIINTGREAAPIDKAVCMTFWHRGPLPMHRPYFEQAPQNFCGDLIPVIGKSKEMKPGDVSTWIFQIAVPDDFDGTTSLYVIGYVLYHDRLTPNRFVMFARKYDPGEGRFIAVKNPDYEGQDSQDSNSEGR